MSRRPLVVAGIDPSLTNCHFMVAPLSWGGDWSLVEHGRYGYSLEQGCSMADRIRRCAAIAVGLKLVFSRLGVTHGYIEHYAFAKAEQAHQLGELGYAIRSHLMSDFDLHEVAISSIRSTLLGKTRARAGEPDIKLQTYEALTAAGLPSEFGGRKKESLDRSDAAAVMNYGMADLGGFAFIGGGR